MQRGWNLLELPRRISLLPKKSLSRALRPHIWEVRGNISLLQNDPHQATWGDTLESKHQVFAAISFILLCFPAAVSALYQTPFAGSCPTLWCTNTWASALTERYPPTSSRSRQPPSTLIPLTHSGSSLGMKMESFTWEWVLVGVGFSAGDKNHWVMTPKGVLVPGLLAKPSNGPKRASLHPKVDQILGLPFQMCLVSKF